MRNVPIEFFVISKSVSNKVEIQKWMRSVGAYDFVIPFGISEADTVVGMVGKRCYMSFEVGLNPNVTKIRSDWVEYIDNILESGHGSVLEHAIYTFAIEGVSRVFTGELNRHRAGVAISEGSMRYIRYNDMPWWLPNSIKEIQDEIKKYATLEIFNETFNFIEKQYARLCELHQIDTLPFKEKKILTSLFRRIIPMGVATGGVWTFNLRALRHVLALRCTPEAEEEICYVMGMIARHMIQEECHIFNDFQIENGFVTVKYKKV